MHPVEICETERQTGTFEEGSAVDEVPPVGEARAARAELGVLWAAFLRTLVALGAPGHTHRAAASVHAVPPGNGGPAALVVVGEVALLRPQVWRREEGTDIVEVKAEAKTLHRKEENIERTKNVVCFSTEQQILNH